MNYICQKCRILTKILDMKKIISLFLVSIFIFGCTSQRQIMDSWMNHTEHEIIMSWGPPSTTNSDGNGGKVLTWSNPLYLTLPNGQPLSMYQYKDMYINSSGRIYSWRTHNERIPPVQVDVRFRNY